MKCYIGDIPWSVGNHTEYLGLTSLNYGNIGFAGTSPNLKEEIIGKRISRKEELHNLLISPNIMRVIKLRTIRWDKHV
jgi:hypothetical protein